MRRKDKEITSRSEIDEIIHSAQVCRLAFAVDNRPYLIPVSFGYDDTRLYVHTAKAGKKIDCIRANPYVCFELERDVQLIADASDPCKWTFTFESVIGYGQMVELTSEDEKRDGLNQIVKHYCDDPRPLKPNTLSSLRVWRIAIDSVTGKRYKPA